MFPKEIQPKLQEIRRVIKQAAPNSQEAISYRMPASNKMVPWYGLQRLRIILGFTQLLQPLSPSKKNSLSIKQAGRHPVPNRSAYST